MLGILKYIASTILIWLRRCSLRRYFRTIEGSISGARFSKVPKSFHTRLSGSKISNLITWELFYAHIININRGSLLTRSFRRIHLSVFKYRLNKNGFAGPKSLRGFRETDPCRSYARFITLQFLITSLKGLKLQHILIFWWTEKGWVQFALQISLAKGNNWSEFPLIELRLCSGRLRQVQCYVLSKLY